MEFIFGELRGRQRLCNNAHQSGCSLSVLLEPLFRTSPSECLIAIRTRCVCVLHSRCSGHSFCCAFPHPNPALHICSLCPSRPVASTSIIPGPAIPMKDLRVSRVSTSPHSLHFLFPHHTLHHVGSISQQDTRELSWGHRLSLLGWHS